jgi:putative membrane protein
MDANFGGGMAIGWIVWLLIVVLFWGLVIAAIVLGIRWLIRADRRGSHEGPATPDALEILRQRYARGEVDETEYERRRAVLKG